MRPELPKGSRRLLPRQSAIGLAIEGLRVQFSSDKTVGPSQYMGNLLGGCFQMLGGQGI